MNTTYINDEQQATLSCAMAAKKAKLHAVIQAPSMLTSTLEAFVHELQASDLGALSAPIIIGGSPLSARTVTWGGHPCGMVSDTIILYVDRCAPIDAYEYIRCDILTRLTVGGSLIVLADTTPYADQVADAVAELLPEVVRVRMGCMGHSAEDLLKLMSSMGPAGFNQYYGLRSDVKLAKAA